LIDWTNELLDVLLRANGLKKGWDIIFEIHFYDDRPLLVWDTRPNRVRPQPFRM
jgi:hypothetical protein